MHGRRVTDGTLLIPETRAEEQLIAYRVMGGLHDHTPISIDRGDASPLTGRWSGPGDWHEGRFDVLIIVRDIRQVDAFGIPVLESVILGHAWLEQRPDGTFESCWSVDASEYGQAHAGTEGGGPILRAT